MKPISQAWFCQIEFTNVCWRDCLYCSRFNRHIREDQRFFMDLETLDRAVQSLDGFEGRIGIIGGEPVVHPQFEEACYLLQKKHKKEKYGLWTSGGPRYEKYRTLINETFGMVAYNEHTPHQEKTCKHQPLTIAIQDVVGDEEYRKKLIDECWVQKTWCPSIGPKGAFFCEVAYAIDSILDGAGGYPIDPGWWKKTPPEFQDQVDRYCKHCGMAIPLEREYIKTKKEKFSPGNLALFKAHKLPKLSDNDVILFGRKLTIEEMEATKSTWDPGNYRGDIREDRKEGYRRKQPK